MEALAKNNVSEIVKKGIDYGINYSDYSELMESLVKNNDTTGELKTEGRINFTKLNQRRMKRWDKTVKVSDEIKEEVLRSNKKVSWLVISESWCGDAAHVLPIINKIAELNNTIDLKIIFRDEHPEVMDEFLTNGARAIPKLISFNHEEEQVEATYGPRPSELTELVRDFKEEHGMLTEEFKEDIQRWYNKDKGKEIVSDLLELM